MNDVTKKIAEGELSKLGLGKKEEPKREQLSLRRSYLDEEPDLGYGRSSLASSPYPSLSSRSQQSSGGGYDMFRKPKPTQERLYLSTPNRTYLKAEAEARLEEWRKIQTPDAGRLTMNPAAYLTVVEEIHLAIGDLMEKAGIVWGTVGSRLLKASVQDAISTGFFQDEAGELYVIEVEK